MAVDYYSAYLTRESPVQERKGSGYSLKYANIAVGIYMP